MAKRIRFVKDSHFNIRPSRIAKRLAVPINVVISKINRHGPQLVRDSLKQFMEKDPFLAKYAPVIDELPSEFREMDKIRSSGVALHASGNQMLFRVAFLSRRSKQLMGQDGFWSLMVYTYGRRSYTIPADKVIPFRVSDNHPKRSKKYSHIRAYDNKIRPRSDYDSVRFVKYLQPHQIPSVAPTYDWIKPAEQFVKNNWRRKILKKI